MRYASGRRSQLDVDAMGISGDTHLIGCTSDDQCSRRYDLKLWITHSPGGATYLPR